MYGVTSISDITTALAKALQQPVNIYRLWNQPGNVYTMVIGEAESTRSAAERAVDEAYERNK